MEEKKGQIIVFKRRKGVGTKIKKCIKKGDLRFEQTTDTATETKMETSNTTRTRTRVAIERTGRTSATRRTAEGKNSSYNH